MLRDAINGLALHKSVHVLELACGTGETIDLLAEHIDADGLFLCTDISAEMLKIAKRRAEKFPGKKVLFEKVDASQIRQREEFDAVICVLGFSVIPDYEKAIAAVHRALRHGGKIAVIDAHLYRRFPFYLLNFFVKILHKIFKAQERDVCLTLNNYFRQIMYNEYLGGSYFLYIGEK